ncbi:MAG: Ig-like domain-containing protein, partial [Bryobacteraceae bacterium]
SVDGAGLLYIANSDAGAVTKYNPATQQSTTILSGLDYPWATAIDAMGDIYVANSSANVINKWSPSTQQGPVLLSGLNIPWGVSVDTAGNVYVVDSYNQAVKVLGPGSQQLTTLVGSGLYYPQDAAADPSGNVYITTAYSAPLQEWNAVTQSVTTFAPTGLSTPFEIASDNVGNLYVTDPTNKTLWEVTSVFVGPASASEPAGPGSDSLLPVLPATAPLSGVFAPTSDQSWLTIGTVSNGIVNFSFTANASTSARTAHIAILGQTIPVTQSGAVPASVAVVSGSNQSAAVNVTFSQPLVAVVKDANGDPLQGITVNFAGPMTGASVASTSAQTGSNGQATVNVTGNTAAGSYSVTASVAGVSGAASYSLTNLAGLPASLALTGGSGQTATVNAQFTYSLSATVTDGYHNPVPNVTVTFAPPAQTGASITFAGGLNTASTNSTGVATSATITANTHAGGPYDVSATAATGSATNNFVLTNTAGTPANVSVNAGNNQQALINATFATNLQVTVTDQYTNPVPYASVTFAAPSSGASGSFQGGGNSIMVNASASGVVTAPIFTANAIGGSYTVTATSGSVKSNFSLANEVQITVSSSLSGPTVTVDNGTPFTGSQTFTWVSGTSHSIAASTPQSGGTGVQYVWQSWSDTGAISHSITVPTGNSTNTANFQTQYMLTTTVAPSSSEGSISPASGWVAANSSVKVTATANSTYVFTGFSNALAGTTNPQSLTVAGPATVTANFETGPDPAIAKSHVGSFRQGDHGDTYTITVTNQGQAPTSGTLQMTDTLPAGLTATSLVGPPNWSCVLATLTCQTSAALASSASAQFTAIVNVADNAAASVTNMATVSGGGDVNPNDNTANDVTSIIQTADLTITDTNSVSFIQNNPASYALVVSNVGPGPTVGTVTVIDTLPSGLTAQGISGMNWTCTLSTLTCTRNDALAPGASYPPITVSVWVNANAPAQVTNLAAVSGGGELNAANDSASDVTLVYQTVQITITAGPYTGLDVIVDGSMVPAPHTLTWYVGSTHTIAAPATQGTHTFLNWSDGGAISHNITVPAAATTYTATYH